LPDPTCGTMRSSRSTMRPSTSSKLLKRCSAFGPSASMMRSQRRCPTSSIQRKRSGPTRQSFPGYCARPNCLSRGGARSHRIPGAFSSLLGQVMAGQDFSGVDRVDPITFNRALWRGLKSSAPYPSPVVGGPAHQPATPSGERTARRPEETASKLDTAEGLRSLEFTRARGKGASILP